MITFKLLQSSQIEIITQMMLDFYAIDNYAFKIVKTKELFKEFCANENLGKAYLIFNDNKIVGYFILTFVFSFEYQGRIAFLDELFIKNEQRGLGIGNKTIQFILSLTNEFNIKMIYLEVENHNENAQKLYLANDFEFHNRKIMTYKNQITNYEIF